MASRPTRTTSSRPTGGMTIWNGAGAGRSLLLDPSDSKKLNMDPPKETPRRNSNPMGPLKNKNQMGSLKNKNLMGSLKNKNQMGPLKNKNQMGPLKNKNQMGSLKNKNQMGSLKNKNPKTGRMGSHKRTGGSSDLMGSLNSNILIEKEMALLKTISEGNCNLLGTSENETGMKDIPTNTDKTISTEGSVINIEGGEDNVMASLRPGGSIIRNPIMGSHGNKGGLEQEVSPGMSLNEGLKIIQLNMNKSRGCMLEVTNSTFDIAIVQEPSVTRGKLNHIKPNQRGFCKGKARAAIIVNNKIDFWPVESYSTPDLAVVALEARQGPMFVCSVYLDILRDPVMEELERLVDFCEARRIALIIGADANAHSVLWGSNDTNSRGTKIEEWILTKGLYVHNIGSTPTFVPARNVSHTIIDITITNNRALEWLSKWRVEEDDMLSDHKMISFEITQDTGNERFDLARKYRKANWEYFTKELGKLDFELSQDVLPDTDTLASNIEHNLQQALDLVAPKVVKKPPTDSWWTAELNEKRKEVFKMNRRKYKDTSTKEKVCKLKREYTNMIKEAKTKSWRDFVTRADSAKEVSKIIQVLENPPARRMSLLKDRDGNVLGPADSLDHLLGTHFPDGELNGQARKSTVYEQVDFTGVCQFITSRKIRAALESFGDYKSPGPDELPPIALKHLDQRHLEAVCLLYQLSVATGVIPATWREMRVTFIPKAGKSDYAIAKAYRPITLSNFILKGLERIIQWYILDHVLSEPLYRQHAYTKGRSCDSALSTFTNEIEYALWNGKHMLAVSLDCSGAFDCITFGSAERCMKRKGIPDNIIRWYVNLLKGRRVHAEVQGQKAHIIPHRGSPQGGVLSPLIWNLIMDSLLTTFKGEPVQVLGYADDILLYVVGKSPATLASMMQRELKRVFDWGNKNGLSFNPSKTSMVLYTRSRRKIQVKVKMNGVSLVQRDSLKYLGVEIQRNLSWAKHIKERTNKCKFLLGKCRSLVSRRWGLTPTKMDWVHKAVIRPKIAYGAVVWAHRLTKRSQKDLARVQRLAMLPITQPLRSAPTAGMEAMLGWIPLNIYVQEMGMNTYLRIKDLVRAGWDGIGQQASTVGHLARWKAVEAKCIGTSFPREKRISEQIWVLPPEIEPDFKLVHPIVMYTDASKEGANVGYSWLASIGDYVMEENVTSAKDISVYKAEMMAVGEALHWLQRNMDTMRTNIILSDSKSVVEKINGHLAQDEMTRDIMVMLRDLNVKVLTEVKWIKAHNGIVGNEWADSLAKKGAAEAIKLLDTKPHMPVPQRQIKKQIHNHYLGVWQEKWESLTDCRISKLFYPRVREDKRVVKMSQQDLQSLTSTVTGHGLYKHHMGHWVDLPDGDQCSLCHEAQEDTWHLWEWCPRLGKDRAVIRLLMQKGLAYERGLVKMMRLKQIESLRARNEALLSP